MILKALFIAMHVALCYVSINFGNMVITAAGLPIIIGAMMFGPISGLEIGLMGSFLNQMLKYGFTATTILWILPAGIKGLLIGAYAKHKNYKLNRKQMIFIIALSAVIVTTMNTAVMYIDSKLYGYYSSIVHLAIIELLMKRISILGFNNQIGEGL